jgi:FMN reductase
VSVAIVIGNHKTNSRTLRVAVAVADALADQIPEKGDRLIVDLADVAAELFEPESQTVSDLMERVAASDIIIVASPTYKATYTGLLKSFFDRYFNNALSGAIAIPVMTGAAPVHALAPEVHLRPLLVELGATTPTRGLYVTEQQFDDLDSVVGAWTDLASPQIARALF